jgi:hypothetical protein
MQERSRQFEPMQFTRVESVSVDVDGGGSVRLQVKGTPDGFYAKVLIDWPALPEYVVRLGWVLVGEPGFPYLDVHLDDVRKAPEAVDWLLTSGVLDEAAAQARELAVRQGSAELGAREMFEARTRG